jgi:DNA-binding transcriptional MerR regulator
MNIQAVARRTGVPAATLRKWEQRYGVLKPSRTAGAHRRYADRDIARVEWLKARLGEGYRIGEAARLMGAQADAQVPRDAAGLVDELVAATADAEVERIARALDQAFALLPPEQAIGEVAEPVLQRIGDLWRDGEAQIVEEHCLTELLRGKLRAILDGGVSGPRGLIVLCCVPGERHECGLLALAALLHADGWGVLYLGADTPLAEATALAKASGAQALCVSATLQELGEKAARDLDRLARRHPDLPIVRGGAAFGGDRASRAVARLRRYARA